MNAVTIKASFKPSRQRKANTPPHSPNVATEPEASSTAPSPAEEVPQRPPSRVACQLALAHLIEREVEAGRLKGFAEAARFFGVSKARMAQVVALLTLSPRIQEGFLFGRLRLSERDLRGVVREAGWEAQERLLGERAS